MRVHRPAAAIFAALALAITLSGCFNYEEEITFDAKGAGKLKYKFERGQHGIFSKTVAEFSWDNPVEDFEKLKSDKPAGIDFKEFKKTDTPEKRAIFEGTFEYDDLDKFNKWKGHGEIEQVFGGLSLKRVEDMLVFERNIIPTDKAQLDKAKEKTLNSQIVLKVTGPGEIAEHNADEVAGQTLIWKKSFAEFLAGENGEGSTLKARFKLPVEDVTPEAGMKKGPAGEKKDSGMALWLIIAVVVVAVVVVGTLVLGGKKEADDTSKGDSA